MKSLEHIYSEHHAIRHREDFAVLETERGELFRRLIGTNKTVLDLGCRDGTLTKYYTSGNKVFGADIDSAMLARARERLGIETVQIDIQEAPWPFRPASFDVVVAGEVLEHVYSPEKVINRITELLKPGGMFIGSVPNAFSLKCRIKYLLGSKRNTPLDDPMHINQFSWHELQKMLSCHSRTTRLYPLGKRYFYLKMFFPSLLAYSMAFCLKKA